MNTLRSRQVKIKVYALDKYSKGIEMANFCSLNADSKNTLPMYFLGGVGVIVDLASDIKDIEIETAVVFCGFSEKDSYDYVITSINNIAKIKGKIKSEYSACGYLAFLINAIRRLFPSIGKDVLVYGEEQDVGLISTLLKEIGCNTYDWRDELLLSENRHADDAILWAEDIDDLVADKISEKCKSTGNLVYVGKLKNTIAPKSQTIHHCIDTGDLSVHADYAQYGKPYPSHYVTASTSNNLRLAYRILAKRKMPIEHSIFKSITVYEQMDNIDTVIEPDISMKVNSILDEFAKIYSSHINVGLLTITWNAKLNSVTKEAVVASAAYILRSGVANYKLIDNDELFSLRAKCSDGSVFCGNIHYGAAIERCTIALHFDSNSIVYCDGQINHFAGDEVKNIVCAEQGFDCDFDKLKGSSALISWRKIIDSREK